MSFILKDNPIAVNIKLTTEGRKRLASGNFNVTKFAIGDSEMDYKFFNRKDINKTLGNVLSPKDNLLDIRYKIKRNFNEDFNLYDVKPLVSKEIAVNCMNMGFFSGEDIYGMEAVINPSYVVEGNLKIDMSDVNPVTPKLLRIRQNDNYLFTAEPEIGGYVLVNWMNPYNTEGNFNLGVIDYDNTSPFLWYKIVGITGTIEANTLVVELDRDIPNMDLVQADTLYSYCMLFPKFNSILEYYGTQKLSDFWIFTVNNYLENCKGDVLITPVWSLNIFTPDTIPGFFLEDTIPEGSVTPVGVETDNPNIFNNFAFGGFLEYINNFRDDKFLGIIHYTNSTPTNQIGEYFYNNEAELLMPTIMWYRNVDNKIGLRLKCGEEIKRLSNFNLTYYDLIDDTGFVVGKCFNTHKIFLIEDQELLFAMSYKSNRNWTLPGVSGIVNNIICLPEENEPISCGQQFQYSGGAAYPTEIIYDLGYGGGTVTLDFNADNIPDRWIVEYDGTIVIDTGYRGNISYDIEGAQRQTFRNNLIGRVDPITGNIYPDFVTYVDDGYPRVIAPGNGIATFEKIGGNLATVFVYGPQGNTGWNFTLSCPV